MKKIRYNLITLTSLLLLFACSEEEKKEFTPLDNSSKQSLKLSKKEQDLLNSLKKYKFIELSPRYSGLENVLKNNKHYIKMYETFHGKHNLLCLKYATNTKEGDIIYSYYITTPGKVSHIADGREDRFGGGPPWINQEVVTFFTLAQMQKENDYKSNPFIEVNPDNYDKTKRLYLILYKEMLNKKDQADSEQSPQ